MSNVTRITSLLLALLALQQPCAAVTEIDITEPAGGGSEVQKRLTEGSEAQRQPETKANSPAVVAAAATLLATIKSQFNLDDSRLKPFCDQIDAVKRREFAAAEVAPSEIVKVFTATNAFVASCSMSSEQGQRLVPALLAQAADFPTPQAPGGNQSNVLAITQTLLFKLPGTFVERLLTWLPNDPRPFTTMDDLLYRFAVSQLPNEHAAQIDTADLQTIYEKISGTEKGTYVLKNQSPFLLIEPEGAHRLFSHDTDYLNWTFKIDGAPLTLVSSDTANGYSGSFIFTNQALPKLAANSVTLTVDSVIGNGTVGQRLRATNKTSTSLQIALSDVVEHTFADMFEVRGWKRDKRGQPLPTLIDKEHGLVRWAYRGLDGHVMATDVTVSGVLPDAISDNGLSWHLSLAPGESVQLETCTVPLLDPPTPAVSTQACLPLDKTRAAADEAYRQWRKQQATIETGNAPANKMIDQAYRDMYILRENTPRGAAIAAGIPWFACAFGRDDLITSLQILPFMPALSRDALRTLAQYQGSKDDAKTAEKPGKIMHELRVGEMARNGEIPFAPYYGTVDATPLWLMLLGRYVERTGDVALAEELAPNVDRALQYLDAEVERGKGYLTYGGSGKEALSNQGWKDSGDSVFYSDGRLAQAPIALCEVQGYLYDAWLQAAKLARLSNKQERALQLDNAASQLRERFTRDFWMPAQGFSAIALDGQGKQVDTVTSNPGHLLMAGILPPDKAAMVAKHLLEPDMFSGFGVRTLRQAQPRYFPNSYHDGSVWPHDNSIIAAGLHDSDAEGAGKLTSAMLAVAAHEPDLRLPELFGGYPRDQFTVPIPYPVSCKPQAWAVGTILLMVASDLGLHIDALHNRLTIDHPHVPEELGTVQLTSLAVGTRQIDLKFSRQGSKTLVQVLANPGNLDVVIKQ